MKGSNRTMTKELMKQGTNRTTTKELMKQGKTQNQLKLKEREQLLDELVNTLGAVDLLNFFTFHEIV